MARRKTDKYVITELKPLSKRGTFRPGHDDHIGDDFHLRLLNTDEDIIKGGFYAESVWLWPGGKYPATPEPRKHYHHFDEIVAFIGTATDPPNDLCGEIEIWLEDEKQVLTK